LHEKYIEKNIGKEEAEAIVEDAEMFLERIKTAIEVMQ